MPTLPLSLLGADAGLWLLLPVAVYGLGHPLHPWYMLHGIVLAMGHPRACPSMTDGPVSRQQE